MNNEKICAPITYHKQFGYRTFFRDDIFFFPYTDLHSQIESIKLFYMVNQTSICLASDTIHFNSHKMGHFARKFSVTLQWYKYKIQFTKFIDSKQMP